MPGEQAREPRPLASRRASNAWGRPAPIAALAALFVASAVFLVLGAFALLGTGFDFWTTDANRGGPGDADPDPDVTALGSSLAFGLLVLVASAALVAVALGLWMGRRWAWMAGLAFVAFAAVAGVILLLGGNLATGLLALAVAVLGAGLLLRRDVQGWFGVARAGIARVGRPA